MTAGATLCNAPAGGAKMTVSATPCNEIAIISVQNQPRKTAWAASLAHAEAGENVARHAFGHATAVELADCAKGKLHVGGCRIDGHTRLECREGSVYKRHCPRQGGMLACRGYDRVGGHRYTLVCEKPVDSLC